MTLSNPYPAGWDLVGDATTLVQNSYVATGATASTPLYGAISHSAALSSFSGAPVQPLVTPARTPLVNGRNAYVRQNTVGNDIALSWTAPASATAPNGYQVTIYSVTNAGGKTVLPAVAGGVTTATELRLPPGTLTAGAEYCALVRSSYAPNLDFARTPFRSSLPADQADLLTGIFTP